MIPTIWCSTRRNLLFDLFEQLRLRIVVNDLEFAGLHSVHGFAGEAFDDERCSEFLVCVAVPVVPPTHAAPPAVEAAPGPRPQEGGAGSSGDRGHLNPGDDADQHRARVSA